MHVRPTFFRADCRGRSHRHGHGEVDVAMRDAMQIGAAMVAAKMALLLLLVAVAWLTK